MKILGIVVLALIFSFFLIIIIGQDRDINILTRENRDRDARIRILQNEILILSKTQRILSLKQELLERKNYPPKKVPFSVDIVENL